MVCVMRKGHPAAFGALTLRAFLALRHLRIVQSAGDVRFVEEALLKSRLQRKVMATTQHWLTAFYIVERSDLVTALPESMVRRLNSDRRFVVASFPWAARSSHGVFTGHRRHDGRLAHRRLKAMFESVAREA